MYQLGGGILVSYERKRGYASPEVQNVPDLGDDIFVASSRVATVRLFADAIAGSDVPDVAQVKHADAVLGVDNPEGVSVPDDASSVDGHLAEVVVGLGVDQEGVAVLLGRAVDKGDADALVVVAVPADHPAIDAVVGALVGGVGRGRDALGHPLLGLEVVVARLGLPGELGGGARHDVVAVGKGVRHVDNVAGFLHDGRQRRQVRIVALVDHDKVGAVELGRAAVAFLRVAEGASGGEGEESGELHYCSFSLVNTG